ncbi:MAG: TIR domain-containing protein [Terricaulis sp.]
MADIFVSYKRDEREAVEWIAAQLRSLGFSVWFDAGMTAGDAFSDEIDREARAAKAILVCWSPSARESRWVKAEAMIGFEHDKLAAAYVGGPDGFSPPTPFNAVHAADLRGYLASPTELHPGWLGVLRRLGKLCGRRDVEEWGALDLGSPSSEPQLKVWLSSNAHSPLAPLVQRALREAEAWRLGAVERERAAQEAHERKLAERESQERLIWRGRMTRRQGRIWSMLTAGLLGLAFSPLDLLAVPPGWNPIAVVGFDAMAALVFAGPLLMAARWLVAISQRRVGMHPRSYFDWPFLIVLAICVAIGVYYVLDTRDSTTLVAGGSFMVGLMAVPVSVLIWALSLTMGGRPVSRSADPPFRTPFERYGWLLILALLVCCVVLYGMGRTPNRA